MDFSGLLPKPGFIRNLEVMKYIARENSNDVLLTIGTWLFMMNFSPPAFYCFVHDYVKLNDLGISNDTWTDEVFKNWSEYLKMDVLWKPIPAQLIDVSHAREGADEVQVFKTILDQDRETVEPEKYIDQTPLAWKEVSKKKAKDKKVKGRATKEVKRKSLLIKVIYLKVRTMTWPLVAQIY